MGRTVALGLLMAAFVACTATSPATSPGATGTSSIGTAVGSLPPGFPIGSWKTTITEDDLRAGGLTGSGEIRENAGTFTMSLEPDGTWTTAQESDEPLRWPVFRGTWQVTGPNSFSQRTDFPAEYAGDVVEFTWRVEDGALVLQVPEPPDPILPIVAETHPWEPAG